MQEGSVHVVFITSTTKNEQSEAGEPSETGEQSETSDQRANQSNELFQSSVDDPSFLKRQKKRLAGTKVVNKIHHAKKDSTGKCSLLRRLFITFATSTCFTFLLTMLMFIPISKIVIGSIFFDECPAEPFIPIYLVVGGTVACIRDLINIAMRLLLTDQAYFDYDVPITLVAFVYSVVEFVWFVYGSVYVYALFDKYQWKDKHAPEFCSSLLYMYAFVLTTMSYFLLLMTCILSSATICAAYCLDEPTPNENPRENHTSVVIVGVKKQSQMPQQQQNQQQLPQQQ